MTRYLLDFRIAGLTAVAAIAAQVPVAPLAHDASVGSVVPIGGHAAEIVLDDPRGILYVVNMSRTSGPPVSMSCRSRNNPWPVLFPWRPIPALFRCLRTAGFLW